MFDLGRSQFVMHVDTHPNKRLCVFLLQLGAPENLSGIEPFLKNLFEDVLPGPLWFGRLLGSFIAKRRCKKIAHIYESLGGGSPLRRNTEAQAQALHDVLEKHGWNNQVFVCMRYAPPRTIEALLKARKAWKDATWVALPLYPQYSLSTTGSSLKELQTLLSTQEQSRLQTVRAYADHQDYVASIVDTIQNAFQRFDTPRDDVQLVFSAHGIPLSLVQKGDPYQKDVEQTVEAVMQRLHLKNPHTIAFQSKIGPVKWLEPNTKDVVQYLGRHGSTKVLVIPISFVSEHLETLYELDEELHELAKLSGIETFVRAPTPGTRSLFIQALAKQVLEAVDKN